MAKYKDKWKTTFPTSIGNQTRPEDGVDNTQEYNTDGLPQYMANDPVRYDLQNAVNSQLVSNDERLNEKIERTSDDLAAHDKNPKAHATGIAGNAATASKLITPRTINLTGKAAGSTSFDGSANASINVTNVNADTASKLSTARKINITGNATGAANFDGSGDVSINVSVNSAAKATNDKNGADIAATYLKKAGGTATGKITFNSTDLNALPEVKKTSDDNMSGVRFSSKSKFLGAVGKCLSNGEDLLNLRSDNTTTDVVLDSRNYGSYALPKSGGTMSGALNFANSTWNTVGDDSYMGDHDISGTFCIKGANGETGIALVNANNEDDYARISYGGGNINFNKTIGGNITGNAATATKATQDTNGRAFADTNAYMHIRWLDNGTDFNNVKTTGIYYCTEGTFANKPYNAWGILTVYSIGTVKQEYRPDNAAAYYTRVYSNSNWTAWSKVAASTADSATTATNADMVDGVHAGSMFYNKGNWGADNWATMGAYQVNGNPPNGNWYGWGQVISSSTNDGRFQLYASDSYGGDGRLHYRTGWDSGKHDWNTILDSENYNIFAPTKTGSGASGTWPISISGNADTVDGYHASDLFRHLGGNQTPVITDIFDRAGTIDMTTMSAADKATHKANINKARNATQNIWNTNTGIYAYGGDYDMSNGYGRGSLKLTQSYKNFDKILVVGANDKGELLMYKLWDVWALANAFAGGSHFQLFHGGGGYWFLYGSARKGTWAGYVLSTDTVWSCQDQNSSIVAIYGIKY